MSKQSEQKRSKTYIDYSKQKHLLLSVVEMLGYKIDKAGSTAKDIKYKSEAFDDVIIVTGSTNFELYYNPNSTERGDVIQFLTNRSGGAVNQSADFIANRTFVDKKLIEASNHTVIYETITPTTRPSVRTSFALCDDKYEIVKLPQTPDEMPDGIVNMLKQRGMTSDIFFDKDIRDSVGILYAKTPDGRKIPNLVFLWKHPDTLEVSGAQYKFYVREEGRLVGKRVFVKDSDRSQSLWMTEIKGKTKLFVTEDVYDAVAHKLLTGDDSYCYVATGGSITAEQIAAIRRLVAQNDVQLILGNDRDGAGMLSSLKIIDDLKGYVYAKGAHTLSFTTSDGRSYCLDYSKSTDEMVFVIKMLATEKNIVIDIPTSKDWNDDLKTYGTTIPSLKIDQ